MSKQAYLKRKKAKQEEKVISPLRRRERRAPETIVSTSLIFQGKQKRKVFALSKALQLVENQPHISWLQTGAPPAELSGLHKTNVMQINYYYGTGEGQGKKKSQNHSKKSVIKFQELEKWKARVRDMIKICLGFRWTVCTAKELVQKELLHPQQWLLSYCLLGIYDVAFFILFSLLFLL